MGYGWENDDNVSDRKDLFLVKQGKKLPTTPKEIEVFEKYFAKELAEAETKRPPLAWLLNLAKKIKGK